MQLELKVSAINSGAIESLDRCNTSCITSGESAWTSIDRADTSFQVQICPVYSIRGMAKILNVTRYEGKVGKTDGRSSPTYR